MTPPGGPLLALGRPRVFCSCSLHHMIKQELSEPDVESIPTCAVSGLPKQARWCSKGGELGIALVFKPPRVFRLYYGSVLPQAKHEAKTSESSFASPLYRSEGLGSEAQSHARTPSRAAMMRTLSPNRSQSGLPDVSASSASTSYPSPSRSVR